MSRMLEALRQLETQSPETPPAVRPVSLEELNSLGSRRSPESETQQPRQPDQASPDAEAVESSESKEPVEREVKVESTEAEETDQRCEPDKWDAALEARLKPGEPAEPAQAAPQLASPGAEQATQPSEPDQEDALRERAGAAVPDAAASDDAPEPAPVRGSDRNVRRLLSPLDEEHQEPYRELAGNILAQLSPGRPAVLMFTSPGDGEGKTSMVAALAVALAEEVAEEVVLVDVNFRSPALANDFGIWADEGLVEVLTGERDWRQVVRKTSAKHLSVLPGGRFVGRDGPLPEDSKLASLLETLRRSHRLVLVDAASLQHPEVAPLSGLCDGTYLVIALGQTERNAARQAARLIKRCGGRVLGCVLTNA